MSYTLISRVVQKARKEHKCIWCGEPIEVGKSYAYERSVFNGDPQSQHWHVECNEAFDQELTYQGGGEMEFEPYANERPETLPT